VETKEGIEKLGEKNECKGGRKKKKRKKINFINQASTILPSPLVVYTLFP